MCLRSGDGFPDVLVVDHDPKFTSDVFRAFVRGMGSCLIVGSAYHKNTNAKVERANGVIGDTLRAFANGRKDDWDRQLPLAVFAINNAASTLGDGLTPFFIDRGAHPRLPLSAPTADGGGSESPGQYAQRMRELELSVRELLAAAQRERKVKLDAGRVDTVFKVGDQVLLRTKELLDAADIGKLRPRWDGPFTVQACPGPNTYTLALPRKMRCSSTVNVDRLKPFHERAGAAVAPPGHRRRVRWRTRGRRASTGGAAAQPQGGAGRHALPGAVARPFVCGRRVAAGDGAGPLPGEGG
jgi:hypothetical protein